MKGGVLKMTVSVRRQESNQSPKAQPNKMAPNRRGNFSISYLPPSDSTIRAAANALNWRRSRAPIHALI